MPYFQQEAAAECTGQGRAGGRGRGSESTPAIPCNANAQQAQTLGNHFSSPPPLHPFWAWPGQQPGQVNRSGWVPAGCGPAVWVAAPSSSGPLSPHRTPPSQHHWVHPRPLLTGHKPRSDERFRGRGWPSGKVRRRGPFSLGRAHDWILLKPPLED